MPLTAELYPGKNIFVDGKLVIFDEPPKLSYNGELNKYAPCNPNSNNQFKVFGIGPSGKRMSQNQALINQDLYDASQTNKDLAFILNDLKTRRRTYADLYESVSPIQALNMRRPVSVIHQG